VRSLKTPQRITLSFAFSYIERAILEGTARRQFGDPEKKEVLRFFGQEAPDCVYCGSLDVRRWDHLISVKRGGETVLGNIVPSCAACDDSKRDLDFRTWMLGRTPGSPTSRGVPDVRERIDRIQQYTSRFEYRNGSVEDRFTPEEAAQLTGIRTKMDELRGEIESFLAGSRRRRSEEATTSRT
jgi:hypothetical protein